MHLTENDLRSLLADDSGGWHRGVTAADVHRRVRRLRARRWRAWGSVAATAGTVVAATLLPGLFLRQPAPAGPAADTPSRSVAVVAKSYPSGGVVQEFPFSGALRDLVVAVRCPAGSRALIWLNAKPVMDRSCAGWSWVSAGLGEVGRQNTLQAVIVPRSAEGDVETLALHTPPYAAEWEVRVLSMSGLACGKDRGRPEGWVCPLITQPGNSPSAGTGPG
ncbi:hypothetical protein [Nonomuraea longicatena]|uniref:Uncharacterized protein n=1 Tax=Nonomuraea longicatena TaxID=83682 RepID=A0ABP3Z5C5_9ACTN